MCVQVERRAELARYEAALDGIRAANEAAADAFLRTLNRPITPSERDACLRAQAGLDVPEGNPLQLRPHSAVCMERYAACMHFVRGVSPIQCCVSI